MQRAVMVPRVRRLLGAMLVLATSAGCDLLIPEAPTIDIPAAPRRVVQPAAEVQIEELSRFDIERVSFSTMSRDPFTKPVRESYVVGSVTVERECDAEAEPLGFTTMNELRLLGLVTGTATPRAMFAPIDNSGKAVIVAEGALVGPRCSHRITEIRDNEVVVTQLSDLEEERTQTVLSLTTNRLDAEVLQ